MSYFIVASSYDGVEVKEFTASGDAEEFCATFLADQRNNAGEILLAVQGFKLEPKVIDVVKAIKLERLNC